MCSAFQLSKNQRLSFDVNEQRASNPLDLIHCDFWDHSSATATEVYLYYVLFVDDYSRFRWLYPLRSKSNFYDVLSVYIKLVQNLFNRKIKLVQSDTGTKFVNHHV